MMCKCVVVEMVWGRSGNWCWGRSGTVADGWGEIRQLVLGGDQATGVGGRSGNWCWGGDQATVADGWGEIRQLH